MEKKKIIALLAFTMLAAASTAYASGTTTIAPGGTYWGQKGTLNSVQMGKLSTNVAIIIAYDTTTYAATSKHLSGDKCFGAGSSDTRIYVRDCVKGVSYPEAPATSDSRAFTDTNWSSL